MWLDLPIPTHAKQVIMRFLSRVKFYEAERGRAKKGEKNGRLISVAVVIVSTLLFYSTCSSSKYESEMMELI